MPSLRTCSGLLAATALLGCGGCVSWLFSGLPTPDRSRPVAMIETTGGIEYGATTEFGILTLGRTATSGPCRVHYFLGQAPMTEDGVIAASDTVFHRAVIDLHTQHVRAWDRPLQAGDELLAIYTPDGLDTVEVAVRLASTAGIEGDVLQDPGVALPPGAGVFVQSREGLRFCGLIAAKAALVQDGSERSYYLLAGLDRLRELVATPEPRNPDMEVRYRPDDIAVKRPRQ
jgi:hypothetical protein